MVGSLWKFITPHLSKWLGEDSSLFTKRQLKSRKRKRVNIRTCTLPSNSRFFNLNHDIFLWNVLKIPFNDLFPNTRVKTLQNLSKRQFKRWKGNKACDENFDWWEIFATKKAYKLKSEGKRRHGTWKKLLHRMEKLSLRGSNGCFED